MREKLFIIGMVAKNYVVGIVKYLAVWLIYKLPYRLF